MDLIYMNSSMQDQGVLSNYEFDLAFGADENNFECQISSSDHCCSPGWFLYIEGTEYGGIIDSIEVRSEENEVVYRGRTWHGVIGSKVIMPLTSSDSPTPDVTIKTVDSNNTSLVDKYLIISGDSHRCIDFLLTRLGLSDLFEAPSGNSGSIIHEFQFDRFTDGYNGISKMLGSVGMRMKLEYIGGKVVVSAACRYDYSTDEEFDMSLVEMRLNKKVNTINHLVCLGSGEMENRTVLHLYVDTNGNISQVQTQTGLNEYSATYDYASIESEEELLSEGTKRLRELWQQDEMVINLDDSSDFYGVGDKIGATDIVTGLSGSATIKKKIVSITNDNTTISYEVGE